MKEHTLFITGGAGYVGAMLADRFSKRPDVKKIICLDKEPQPELIAGNPKVVWIIGNTSDGTWQEKVRAAEPDIVINTAWQIREMYGQKALQWKWNVDGALAVFDFAFSTASVKELIHFSTVSSYAAYSTNTLEHRFTEAESFRKSDYLYAEEKRVVEEGLEARYKAAKAKGSAPIVTVVRPAAITGPRGRYGRIRFGLQAALSGQLKETFIHRVISAMVSFVPITPKWLRQFIHEDDITDIVEVIAFDNPNKKAYDYGIFNLCPPGDVVLGKDMAAAVGKKPVMIYPWMIRIVFFVMWHISRGKVPTSKGGWKSYSYPIAVDGSKATRILGYHYKYPSKDAFVKKEGRYAAVYCK